MDFDIARNVDPNTGAESFVIKATGGGKTYEATITKDQMGTPGKVVLKNGTSTTDTITLTFPSYTDVISSGTLENGAQWSKNLNAKPGTDWTEDDFKNGKVLGGLTFNLKDPAKYPITQLDLSYNKATGDFTLTFTPTGGGQETVTFKKDGLGKAQQHKMVLRSICRLMTSCCLFLTKLRLLIRNIK